jgi:hypothetical protein
MHAAFDRLVWLVGFVYLFAFGIMLSAIGCTIGEGAAPPEPILDPPANAPDAGPNPDPDGGNDGVPPIASEQPSISQQSSCGGIQAITLSQSVTANGCNLAAGARSGCPSSRPSNRTMDGAFAACLLGPNQSNCQTTTPFVECPVGHNPGPFTITYGPPTGQAGYGFEVSIVRASANGSISLDYEAWEVGVRADGSIAWEGPHAFASNQVSDDGCCDIDYLTVFPGSNLGEKVHVDLQWF